MNLDNHFENMCEEQKPKINQDKAKKKKKQPSIVNDV